MVNIQHSVASQEKKKRVVVEESKINPFEHELKITLARKVQIAVMSVTVFPLRLIMIGIALFVSWLTAYIISFNMPISSPKPAGALRQKFITAWVKLFRLMFFFAGFHRIEIEGQRAKAEEAPILIIGPHSSMMDMFVFCVTSPLPSLVSAMKNIHVTAFGSISRISQPIFIQRNDRDSKIKTGHEMERRANGPDTWPQMAIFPEATCTNRKSFISFKNGAFAPGAPVQPVVLEYKNDFDTLSWTIGSPGTYKLLWLSLCQFSIKAKITYMPVYYPSEKEKLDPTLYANNVRKTMAEKANLPCTDHAYEDCRLIWKAMSFNLPWRAGVVEFSKLKNELGVSYDTMVEKLSEFSKISTDRTDGKVLISDLAKHFNVPITTSLREMFISESITSDDAISFRQFLIGSASTYDIQEKTNK